MLKIGITGNIASGKSELEKILKNEGFKVLCLDYITHLIYENDKEFQKELINIFNTTNRSEISKIVFDDKNKLKLLENIIYPKIKNLMDDFFIENKDEKFIFVSAAMLFEAGFDTYFDKIIFISADYNLRLERLIKRNNLTLNEAKKRMASQDSEENKIKKSNYIIYNNLSLENLAYDAKKIIKGISTL